MATFRNITGDTHVLTFGLPPDPISGRPVEELVVTDGATFEVTTMAAPNYAVQPEMWEPVDAMAHAAVAYVAEPPAEKPAKASSKKKT